MEAERIWFREWRPSSRGWSVLTLLPTQTARWWLGRGFWTLVDQTLFTVTNFILNVVLARLLTLQDYGAFTVTFAIFLLLGAFHMALLIEPMFIFGLGRYADRFSEYLNILLYGHIGFAVFSSLLLLFAGLGFAFAKGSAVSSTLLALACAAPFVLFLWLMRGVCYIRPDGLSWAAAGGGLYMILMLVGIYVLSRYGWISAASGFGMMGIASLVGGGWLAVRLRLSRLSLVNSAFVHETFERHWSYGRWSVATYALIWAPENVYYLLLPLWGGLEASAALKALMNLFLPLLRVYTAVSPLLITTLMRVREQAQFDRLVRNFLILFSCSAVFYWILISLFHRSLISWLYGDQYREYTNLLWLLGASLLPAGVIAVFSGALRALERPDQLFWAYTLSTLVVLTCGLGLTVTYGIVGAVSGLCLAGAVAAVAMGVSYQRLRRSHLY